MKLIWLGHSGWLIEHNSNKILIDPFVDGNKCFPKQMETHIAKVDYILLTHAHPDHIGDTIKISKKCSPVIISIFELYSWLTANGVKNCMEMNIGGELNIEDFKVHMVQAVHSSSITIESGKYIYGGEAAGFVIEIGGHKIYHAGDTGIFSDMELIQKIYEPDIGLIPIGDRATMGVHTASIACNEFLNLKTIIPMHYDTFPLLTGKPEEFKKKVSNGTVVILSPGESFDI